jgi:hypothetical protein
MIIWVDGVGSGSDVFSSGFRWRKSCLLPAALPPATCLPRTCLYRAAPLPRRVPRACLPRAAAPRDAACNAALLPPAHLRAHAIVYMLQLVMAGGTAVFELVAESSGQP